MANPPRTFTVKIPTKTYIRKYLYKKYGPPLHLNYWDTLGTVVLSILEKQSFDINLNTEKSEIRLSYMKDEIEFISSIGTMNYKGHSINPDKIIAINRFFEDIFSEHLYQYCRDNRSGSAWRPGIDKAIYNFAEICGIIIDTDISFDALKKAEYRHRKKQEKILQTFVLPPKNPYRPGSFNASFSC